MLRKDINPIYYFLIMNQSNKTEIGNIFHHQNGTIEDFNLIEEFKQRIINLLSPIKNLTIRKTLNNHTIYGKSIQAKVFYFIVICKKSALHFTKKLIDELINKTEHEGIRKMLLPNGELSQIGIKTLRFSLEQFIMSQHRNHYKNIPSLSHSKCTKHKNLRLFYLFKYISILLTIIKLNQLILELIDTFKQEHRKTRHRFRRNNYINYQFDYINKVNREHREIKQLNDKVHFLYHIVIVLLFIFILIILKPINYNQSLPD